MLGKVKVNILILKTRNLKPREVKWLIQVTCGWARAPGLQSSQLRLPWKVALPVTCLHHLYCGPKDFQKLTQRSNRDQLWGFLSNGHFLNNKWIRTEEKLNQFSPFQHQSNHLERTWTIWGEVASSDEDAVCFVWLKSETGATVDLNDGLF